MLIPTIHRPRKCNGCGKAPAIVVSFEHGGWICEDCARRTVRLFECWHAQGSKKRARRASR